MKIGFFDEGKNNRSFIRLASGVIILAALMWGTIDVVASIWDGSHTVHTELIIGVLLVGITGKVAQKYKEVKPSKLENEESENSSST